MRCVKLEENEIYVWIIKNRREYTRRDGTRVAVLTCREGRLTVFFHEEGWTAYYAIKRPCVPLRANPLFWRIQPIRDSGPGRLFVHMPVIVHRSRRQIVFAQSGGLDI